MEYELIKETSDRFDYLVKNELISDEIKKEIVIALNGYSLELFKQSRSIDLVIRDKYRITELLIRNYEGSIKYSDAWSIDKEFHKNTHTELTNFVSYSGNLSSFSSSARCTILSIWNMYLFNNIGNALNSFNGVENDIEEDVVKYCEGFLNKYSHL